MTVEPITIVEKLLNYNEKINKEFKTKSINLINTLPAFKFIPNYINIIPEESFTKLISGIEVNNPKLKNKITESDINYLYFAFLNNKSVSNDMKDTILLSLLTKDLKDKDKKNIYTAENLSLDLKIKYLKQYFPEKPIENCITYFYTVNETLTKEMLKNVIPSKVSKKELQSLIFDNTITNIEKDLISLKMIDDKIEESKTTLIKDFNSSNFNSNVEEFIYHLQKKDLEIFISKPISEQLKYFSYYTEEHKEKQLLNYYLNYIKKFKLNKEKINKIPEPFIFILKEMSLEEIEKIIEKELKELNKLGNNSSKIKLKHLKITNILVKSQGKTNEIYEKYNKVIEFPNYTSTDLNPEIYTKEKILKILKESKKEYKKEVILIFLDEKFNIDEKTLLEIFNENKEIFDTNVIYTLLDKNFFIKNNKFLLSILENINYDELIINMLPEKQILTPKLIKLLENKYNENKQESQNIINNLIYHQPLINKNQKNKLKDDYSDDLGILYNYNYVLDNLDMYEYKEKVKKYVSDFENNIPGGNKFNIFCNYVICSTLKDNGLRVINDGKIITEIEYQTILKELEKSNEIKKISYSTDYGLSI